MYSLGTGTWLTCVHIFVQGVELGPLEIQINSLLKSLDAQQLNIVQLQQLWLRQQGELVRLSLDKDQQSSTVEQHGRQLTILCQKKIRVEGDADDNPPPSLVTCHVT